MTTCAYCEQRATVKIPSNPGRVCVTHAVEFWAALFDVVKERAVPAESRVDRCSCGSCKELTAAHARAFGAAAVDVAPQPSVPTTRRPRPSAAHQPARNA
jgi:hypothetical protein